MSGAVETPIFFLGMPRSGTTIVFEAFARHPDLAWPSNYTKAYPRLPWLNGLRRLLDNRWLRVYGSKKQYQKQHFLSTYLPRPNEAYSFWDAGMATGFSREWLIDTDCDPQAAAALRRRAKSVCFWQGRSRFSAKTTGPPRMQFLRSVFGDDAVFVHVIRDPRAVVESLLNVDFWRALGGFERPLWNGGLDSRELAAWDRDGRDPGVLAAMQWRRVVEIARREAAGSPDGRYIEVRYETFMADPHGGLQDLYRRCGMSDADEAHRAIDTGPTLRNMNDKFRQRFGEDYIEQLSEASEPMLSDLGYA